MEQIDKKIYMCLLLEFYGKLLTEKQQQMFDDYWNNDLSLFEIAETYGITRQAVHDCLATSEQILLETEQKCGFIAKYKSSVVIIDDLIDMLSGNDEAVAKLQKLKDLL